MLTAGQVDPRELMTRAQQGDLDAFAQLYTRYHRIILAIAHRYHPGRGEDIAQDVWVRALGALHAWRDQGHTPMAWLKTITLNLCRDRAKSSYARLVDIVDAVPERAAAPERTDPALLAGDHLARRDLLAALARVSARQREALVLYYLGELSVAEVAAQMGQSEGGVKNLLHHGRQSMAHKLTRDIHIEEIVQ